MLFRNGRFIIFTQQSDDETLTNWLKENTEKNSFDLSDLNFEHDTQAATGGTTGDWFVLL